jgi:glycosyltransferase involved in cell wall biosynthesis
MMVSIIMLTYNHEKFIGDAINGVLIQKTTFPFELIVANDHSKDSTETVIEDFRSKNPGVIKGYNNSKNLGPRYNFIKAYHAATGKYIAMCEGDDYWTDPAKLQKQVDFLENNMDHILCFHDIEIVAEDGKAMENNILAEKDKRNYDVNEMLGIYVPTPAIMYRKAIRRLPSYFKKTDNGDTMILAMLTPFGKAKFLPDISRSFVRKHVGGIWTSKSRLERLKNTLQIRYLIFKNMVPSLKPVMYKEYVEIFDSASLESIQKDSSFYWYRYNLWYVRFCISAGKYGRAWLLGRRMLKRYLGYKNWLPSYHS